ncbi:MAG: hypothetical protein AB1650_04315 [Candidatus Omnitrophota bacterium]
MDIYDKWIEALKNTQIIRPRVSSLHFDTDTPMPYVFLGESSVNHGDTVVRKGEVSIRKPSLILPANMPQLEGFEFEGGGSLPDSIANFFIVRGISIPSYHYNNKTVQIDVFEGRLSKAIAFYRDELQRTEDVTAGLVAGPEDCWQFSILLYNCSQVVKNADRDIQRLLDEFRRNTDK